MSITSSSLVLTIIKGPNPGKIFTIQPPSRTIGRSSVSDIVIDEPSISRQHARITLTDAGLLIEDLGSSNGTFVNGQRISKVQPLILRLGDTIQLGHKVRLKTQPARIDLSVQTAVKPKQFGGHSAIPDAPTMIPFRLGTPPQPMETEVVSEVETGAVSEVETGAVPEVETSPLPEPSPVSWATRFLSRIAGVVKK